MSQIKVVINGALGRMGQQVVSAVAAEPDLVLVGAADIKAADRDHLSAPALSKKVPLHSSLISIISPFLKTAPGMSKLALLLCLSYRTCHIVALCEIPC